MHEVTLTVLDKDLRIAGYFNSGFTLTWSRVLHQAQSGTIEARGDERLANLLRSPNISVIVNVNQRVFGCGRSAGVEADLRTPINANATFTGVLGELNYLLAFPAPGMGVAEQTFDFTATGVAETVIKNLVVANSQRLGGAVWNAAATQGRGETITVKGRFDTIAEMLKNVWAQTGLVWDAELQGSPGQPYAPWLICRAPVNVMPKIGHDSRVLGNEPKWVAKPAEATHVVAAGAGEGTSRLLMSIAPTLDESVWRRELFFSDSKYTAPGELGGAATGALNEKRRIRSVGGIGFSLVGRWGWLHGHDIGDVCTVTTPWGDAQSPISQVTLTVGESGDVQILTNVGEASWSPFGEMMKADLDTKRRVSRLERR